MQTGLWRSNRSGAPSTRSKLAAYTRIFGSTGRSFGRARSPAGTSGRRWSRTCGSRKRFEAAGLGRNGLRRSPRPWLPRTVSPWGRRSPSNGLRPRNGRSRDASRSSREEAMRFRLEIDGERRDIEIEPRAGGFEVRVDGARYHVRARSTADTMVIRIEARGLHVMLTGDNANLVAVD